jgi:hypothetical protein
MVAMAASVTTIFINSLWGRGSYFFEAISTVGHTPERRSRPSAEGVKSSIPTSAPRVALDQHPQP